MSPTRLARPAGALFILCFAAAAYSQAPARRFEVQGAAGWAAFPDEGVNAHGLAGGSFQAFIRGGFFAGAESFYWVGPDDDRDVTVFPYAGYEWNRQGRARPYVLGGVGWLYHKQLVTSGTSWGRGNTYGGGFGVKLPLTDRLFIAPEVRLGWEPFIRTTAGVGYRF